MRKKKQIDIKGLIRSAITLAIIAVVIAGVVIAAPFVISGYRTSQAERAISDSRPERAIEMLLPELDRNPKDTNLRLKIVDLYIQTGNYSRAEYLLVHGTLEKAGQIDLYRRLCSVFVSQDKLYDAVNMIDNQTNPNIRETLISERPPAPVLSPTPGAYREALTIEATVREGDTCYISLNGEVPTLAEIYATPISLPQGITDVKAVAVSPQGLVSEWVTESYRLDDVIEPVIFEDANVEKIVREMLDMPNGVIVSDKLQAITEFIVPEAVEYTTLNDLRHFTHLVTLKLVGTESIVDISALSYLSELKVLSLTTFGIDSFNLDAVGQIPNLEHLDLSDNHIVSLESLKGLTSLKTLILNSNNILDLTPLSELKLLEKLLLNQNAVESTSPLLELSNLNFLELSGNRISALRGLASMAGLLELDLSGNVIEGEENVKFLSGLSSLKKLNLSSNRSLVDISPVGQLGNLESLSADNCAIEDITALGGLAYLTFLSLNDNVLTTLDGLQGAGSLKVLWANKNQINTLQALSQLSQLTEIHIEYNKLPSLVKIKDLPALKSVYAFGNPITETVAFREGVSVNTGRQ